MSTEIAIGRPKVFISYSWTSPEHRSRVLEWAERLVGDGIDVILDLWNLEEGQDKYAFMESMVSDPSVTNVLLLSDRVYAEKADGRLGGVGTETQIVSREMYEKVTQTKFIPIVCEFKPDGEPYLPVFLASRKWINFSTAEDANENWETLVRRIYKKPELRKPSLGSPPGYIVEDDASPRDPLAGKWNHLRQAILHGKSSVHVGRLDFLEACNSYVEALRPDGAIDNTRAMGDVASLEIAIGHLIDWVLLDASKNPDGQFEQSLEWLLERMIEWKHRPVAVTHWNQRWVEPLSVVVYKLFLHIVAALVRARKYELLGRLLRGHYLLSESQRAAGSTYGNISEFICYEAEFIQESRPASQGRYHAPAFAYVIQSSKRSDINPAQLKEADAICLVVMAAQNNGQEKSPAWWYPQGLLYPSLGQSLFFLRAARSRDFQHLATIVGIDHADAMRNAVGSGIRRMAARWTTLLEAGTAGPFEYINVARWDSLE